MDRVVDASPTVKNTNNNGIVLIMMDIISLYPTNILDKSIVKVK